MSEQSDYGQASAANYVSVSSVNGNPKSKIVALLLCFFLGYLGIHKFYEGKIIWGIVYILTGGLFYIGVIVDFIRLLFKPDPYYVD